MSQGCYEPRDNTQSSRTCCPSNNNNNNNNNRNNNKIKTTPEAITIESNNQ